MTTGFLEGFQVGEYRGDVGRAVAGVVLLEHIVEEAAAGLELPRAAALERLQKLATSESRPLQVQAERLLDAVELLAKPAEG